MSSRSEQIRANAQRADELVKELSTQGNLMPKDGVKNSVFTNQLPAADDKGAISAEPAVDNEATEEPSINNSSAKETRLGGEPVVNESPSDKQYKAAVKAMNEAQREKAELEKLMKKQLEDSDSLKTELENIKKQIGTKQKEETSVTNLDDVFSEWENDLPDTTRMVKSATNAIKEDLSRMFSEKLLTVEQQLNDQKKEKELIKLQEIVRLRDERVKTVHPDYDDIRFSDEFKTWIYEDAPSIYKSVYEGTVSFDERDASRVIEDYKSSKGISANKSTSPKSKPGAAEVSVKTQSAVSPDMGLSTNEETFTADDLAKLPYMINRIRDPKERKALMDRADKYMTKQLSK